MTNADLLGQRCDVESCGEPAVIVLARHVDGYTREDPVLGTCRSRKAVGQMHPRCVRHLQVPLPPDGTAEVEP